MLYAIVLKLWNFFALRTDSLLQNADAIYVYIAIPTNLRRDA